MLAILLTEENLAFLKRTVRSGYPSARSSHISEALACALGQHTHAALLAHMNAAGERHLVRFDKTRFVDRLAQLDPLCGRPESQWQFPRSSQLPMPIWREFKDGEILGQNSWFYECQRNGIPFVYIAIRRKYARVEWDCISLDPQYDNVINGENSKTLIDTMFKRFQFLAKPRKAFFEGSAFVGHIDPLTTDAASKIADEMFGLLYSTIGLNESLVSS
jgi:hypothetical protein